MIGGYVRTIKGNVHCNVYCVVKYYIRMFPIIIRVRSLSLPGFEMVLSSGEFEWIDDKDEVRLLELFYD